MDDALRELLDANPVAGWPCLGLSYDDASRRGELYLLCTLPLRHSAATARAADRCHRWLHAACAGAPKANDGTTVPPLPADVSGGEVTLVLLTLDATDPLGAIAGTRAGRRWAPQASWRGLSSLAADHPVLVEAGAEVRWFYPREELAEHAELGPAAAALSAALGRSRANADGWSWMDMHSNMLAVLRGLRTLQGDFLELRLSGPGVEKWPALRPEGLEDWDLFNRVAARWLLRPEEVAPLVAELNAAES